MLVVLGLVASLRTIELGIGSSGKAAKAQLQRFLMA